MEAMVKLNNKEDDTDANDTTQYLMEEDLPQGNLALRNLWRRCLGVESEEGSSMTSSQFEMTQNILSFLENYKKDTTEVDSSYVHGTKRKILGTSTPCTIAPGTT